jgi:hypothetical protein
MKGRPSRPLQPIERTMLDLARQSARAAQDYEDRLLSELWRSGVDANELAAIYGTSRSGIYRRLWRATALEH